MVMMTIMITIVIIIMISSSLHYLTDHTIMRVKGIAGRPSWHQRFEVHPTDLGFGEEPANDDCDEDMMMMVIIVVVMMMVIISGSKITILFLV